MVVWSAPHLVAFPSPSPEGASHSFIPLSDQVDSSQANHGEFEPIYKMSRLDALNTSGLPLPVKFRQVLHDSSLLDHKVDKLEEESDADSVLSDTESSLPTEFHRKFFFKDPLHPPAKFLEEEKRSGEKQEVSSTIKLGRNMRASNGPIGEETLKLIAERSRLLSQLKDQQILCQKQVESEQAAAVLVSDLIRNGFHITPPDSTPRPQNVSHTSPEITKLVDRDEDSCKNITGRGQLLVAIHRELKKLQKNSTEIS